MRISSTKTDSIEPTGATRSSKLIGRGPVPGSTMRSRRRVAPWNSSLFPACFSLALTKVYPLQLSR